MAERRAFSISRATDFLVKRRIERASDAFLPRIKSRTSFAFWGDVLTYFALAWTSSMAYPCAFPAPAPAPPPGPDGGAPATFATFSTLDEWPLNWRVGENSPNLCPTIFSVM